MSCKLPTSHVVMLLVTLISLLSRVAAEGSHGENGIIGDSPQARHIFNLSDSDQNRLLSRAELHTVFLDFDANNDGNVTSTEFITDWVHRNIGDVPQALRLFLNLDVNRDLVIDEVSDMPYIFIFFDRNIDEQISEGEFVIQWVKIST